MASQEGHDQVVTLLIAAGCDVDKAADGGFTPLFIASQEGHGQVVCCITESHVACAHNEWLDCKDFARFALRARGLPLPVLTDGRPAALLALRPLPTMLADGCPTALLATRPTSTMLADGCPAALLALRPHPTMFASILLLFSLRQKQTFHISYSERGGAGGEVPFPFAGAAGARCARLQLRWRRGGRRRRRRRVAAPFVPILDRRLSVDQKHDRTLAEIEAERCRRLENIRLQKLQEAQQQAEVEEEER